MTYELKKKIDIGVKLMLTRYKGKVGTRFGTVEECNNKTFLVKMLADSDGDTVHPDKADYRRYFYDEIEDGDILVCAK